MAGKFVDRRLDLLQMDHGRPRTRPGRLIVDADLVVDPIGRDTGEALNEPQVLSRPQEVALRREIRGLDDECVAFPLAAGIPAPLADGLAEVGTTIERNDPRVVVGLHQEHDIAGRLDNLIVTILRVPTGARSHSGCPRGDAARGVVDVFRALRNAVSRRGGRAPLLSLRRQRWLSSVRRVHDQ